MRPTGVSAQAELVRSTQKPLGAGAAPLTGAIVSALQPGAPSMQANVSPRSSS
jgi:hypothetical protein